MAINTGLERIAQVVRWLSWGWIGVALFGAVYAIGTGSGQNIDALYVGLGLFLVAGVLPAALGLLVAWIIDGFAKKEG